MSVSFTLLIRPQISSLVVNHADNVPQISCYRFSKMLNMMIYRSIVLSIVLSVYRSIVLSFCPSFYHLLFYHSIFI